MPDAAVTDAPRDDSLVKAGALLLAGRQAGAAMFMLAVLALPRLAPRATVDTVVWSVFAVLLLSSVLDLGLERVAAIAVADEAATRAERTSMRSLLRFRMLTLPLTLVGVALVFWLGNVHSTVPVMIWTAVWTAAVQVQGVAFAGHRALQKRIHEPVAGFAGRGVQSVLLVGLAARHTSPVWLVGVMAAVDVVVAVVACRAIRGCRPARPSERTAFRGRGLAMFTAVEVLAFAYLRADTLIVSRLLGSGTGASYSLVYRVVDGVTGLATPFLLVVFPAAAGMLASGRGLEALRRSTARLAPAAGLGCAVAALLLSVPLVALVPRLAEGAGALHVLLAAIPLFFFSAFELHLRSAEGDNGRIVLLGAAVLTLNIGLNLLLVPPFGLRGAAIALVCCEAAQAGWILWSGWRRGSGTIALYLTLGVALLLVIGRALDTRDTTMAFAYCATALVATAYWLLRDDSSPWRAA